MRVEYPSNGQESLKIKLEKLRHKLQEFEKTKELLEIEQDAIKIRTETLKIRMAELEMLKIQILEALDGINKTLACETNPDETENGLQLLKNLYLDLLKPQ